ncbi:hypothetical protein ABFV99_13055, partial [Cytobacillus horneckiae]|uniref:hypothetical protein n=1 Tax=Cytobacillus horneckiae TaxID=549687 RepID=UPI0034D003A4
INKNYSNYHSFRALLNGLTDSSSEDSIKRIVDFLTPLRFLFPLPSGAISEEQWSWCFVVKEFLLHLDRYDSFDLEKDFIEYLKQNDLFESDAMLKHRLIILFGKDVL